MKEQKNIIKALILFQSKVNSISKKSENPFFKSVYADYETVVKETRQILVDCALTVYHTMSQGEMNQTTITTILAHESGESIESNLTMTHDNKPHSVGSAITYAKRYSYIAILGLATGDDDGNTANDSVNNSVKDATKRVSKLPSDIKTALKKSGITDALMADKFCNDLNYDLASIRVKLSINVHLEATA